MEALADSFLEQPPVDYDSDAAADEIGQVTESAAYSSKISICIQKYFKNALENQTSSKANLKNHVPQARAPSRYAASQSTYTRHLLGFYKITIGPVSPQCSPLSLSFLSITLLIRELTINRGSTTPNRDHLYQFVYTNLEDNITSFFHQGSSIYQNYLQYPLYYQQYFDRDL